MNKLREYWLESIVYFRVLITEIHNNSSTNATIQKLRILSEKILVILNIPELEMLFTILLEKLQSTTFFLVVGSNEPQNHIREFSHIAEKIGILISTKIPQSSRVIHMNICYFLVILDLYKSENETERINTLMNNIKNSTTDNTFDNSVGSMLKSLPPQISSKAIESIIETVDLEGINYYKFNTIIPAGNNHYFLNFSANQTRTIYNVGLIPNAIIVVSASPIGGTYPNSGGWSTIQYLRNMLPCLTETRTKFRYATIRYNEDIDVTPPCNPTPISSTIKDLESTKDLEPPLPSPFAKNLSIGKSCEESIVTIPEENKSEYFIIPETGKYFWRILSEDSEELMTSDSGSLIRFSQNPDYLMITEYNFEKGARTAMLEGKWLHAVLFSSEYFPEATEEYSTKPNLVRQEVGPTSGFTTLEHFNLANPGYYSVRAAGLHSDTITKFLLPGDTITIILGGINNSSSIHLPEGILQLDCGTGNQLASSELYEFA